MTMAGDGVYPGDSGAIEVEGPCPGMSGRACRVPLVIAAALFLLVVGTSAEAEGIPHHLRHHQHHRAIHQDHYPARAATSAGDDGKPLGINAIFQRFVGSGSKPKRSPIPRQDDVPPPPVSSSASPSSSESSPPLVPHLPSVQPHPNELPLSMTSCDNCTPASEPERNVSGSDAHHASDNEHGHEGEHHGIHVASWRWDYVQSPFIYTFFVVLAGMCKVGFHHADFLSSLLPESCLLILLGTLVGGIVYITGSQDVIPNFESRTFFLFLLPPIMLESAYSLHDRAFAENLGTVLLYAVVGTIINCFLIGPTLFGLAEVGAMGTIAIGGVEALVFSALISAVDPVAVLAIFQEIGVNKDLYFLVFGESLLNDAVTVVIYTMMVAFTTMETITADQVGLGIAAFFCVSVGGLSIGIIFGILTALITKVTEEVRVVEPLAMLGMAYLSYLTAEMVHFSGIISIIGCGLVQAQYAIANISSKSYTTVKYFSKMLSATCDCIIFFFLGMVLINDKHIWHTGFVLWALFLCLLYRFFSVFLLTFIVNNSEKIRYIDYQEQFIMAYGGLRGAVCFSLVIMLDEDWIPNKNLFVTTTLVIVLFTVFIQGGTIKPLVKWLDIRIHKEGYLSLTSEINSTLIDHVMGGVEEIAGERGENYLKLLIYRYDEKYLKKWLQRDAGGSSSLTTVYEKLAIQDHYAHLYGPAAQNDAEKHMKLQSSLHGDMAEDHMPPRKDHIESIPRGPSPPPPKPQPAQPPKPVQTTKGPACPFSSAMFANTVKPKGKVSSIAATLVGVGQTIASPLMMDTMQATQTLRKALRENHFNKFHMKYNPNLIRDDEQEIGEQLRLRRLRARRLTMAALSPSTSNQSSRTDLSQIPEAELDGVHGGVHNDRTRSQSLAATTEILAERARQRRRQNMVKAHTVEGDGHPISGSGPAHRQVTFLRNGSITSSTDSEKGTPAPNLRHSAGDLELKSVALLDTITEHENGDEESKSATASPSCEHPPNESSDEPRDDESSPFLEHADSATNERRRQRLNKVHKVDLPDDPETTV